MPDVFIKTKFGRRKKQYSHSNLDKIDSSDNEFETKINQESQQFDSDDIDEN